VQLAALKVVIALDWAVFYVLTNTV